MGCGKSKHDDIATGNTVVTRQKCVINNTDAFKKNTEADITKSLLVEQKEGGHDHKDELNNENGGGGGGRLISKESPNRFFSSRKEDQEESSSIDGFGLEGKSEKSEYLTPRQEAGKEIVFFSDKFEKVDVGVEESTTTTTTTTGETKIEVGASEKIKEENLMEETAAEKEKTKDIETEVLSLSSPATANAEKKNLQNDEKEQLIASPTKDDQKTV